MDFLMTPIKFANLAIIYVILVSEIKQKIVSLVNRIGHYIRIK
jgi:hypothetical protein